MKFSLKTLLLCVAILCLAIVLGTQSRQLQHASSELRKLRDETGRLNVGDPNKVHVIAVDPSEPDTWQWRIFLPKGARYKWCLAYGAIPAQGVPHAMMEGISNEPYWETDTMPFVTAVLRRADNGQWTLSVTSKIGDSANQIGGASLKIPDKEMQWTREVPSREGHTLGSSGTEILDPDGPIVLLQWRACEKLPSGTFQPSANPMPGYMIWLEKW